eukprot:scaffold133423_cov79-Phaeocystis_antarctica.AAC.1
MMSYSMRLGERAAREAVEDGVGISGEQEEARDVMRRRVQLATLHDPLHLVDGVKATMVRGEDIQHRTPYTLRVEIRGHLVHHRSCHDARSNRGAARLRPHASVVS